MSNILEKYKDNVWCISLANRDDRYDVVWKEFERIKINDVVNYYRPEKDIRGGRYGCWLSHLECYKKILENSNSKFGIIFEDDACFESNWKEGLEKINIFMDSNTEWDIIWLGNLVTSYISESNIEEIWKCKSYNTHGYIISRDYINKLINTEKFHPENYPNGLDDYFHENTDNFYCMLDQICYQNNMSSDNQWFQYNLLQNIFQGKYTWKLSQKISNKIAKYLRFLPISIQEIMNPLPCLITINCWLNELIS